MDFKKRSEEIFFGREEGHHDASPPHNYCPDCKFCEECTEKNIAPALSEAHAAGRREAYLDAVEFCDAVVIQDEAYGGHNAGFRNACAHLAKMFEVKAKSLASPAPKDPA